MHSPSSCSRTARGNSPSLGVKDPISSQSQKNEGCFLKWFQLSWEGEVPCYLRVVHSEYRTQLSHTHLDGSLQVTDEDIGEMQISEVLSGGRCLLMSRVWQQCVDALTFTMEKTLSSTHWRSTAHIRGQLVHTLTLKQFISVVLCFPTMKEHIITYNK